MISNNIQSINPLPLLVTGTVKKSLPIFLLMIMGYGMAIAQNQGKQSFVRKSHQHIKSMNQSKVSFIENKGQWGHDIRYKAEIPGGVFFMTGKGFVYNFINQKDFDKFNERIESEKDPIPNGLHFHAYKMNFVGSNQPTKISDKGIDKRDYYYNYIMDDNPKKWKGHVHLYGKTKLDNVYNGIDVQVYEIPANRNGNTVGIAYDFVVDAGANANQIQLSFEGVQPKIAKNGNLIIKTTVNTIIEEAPYSYQEINGQRVEVSSDYVLKEGTLSFSFPKGYNKSYPLIIDPNLVFATYSGGHSSAFYAHTTTFDNQGNAYASPLASGVGWPTTAGAYQQTFPGFSCTAINKYSYNGSQLLYSTYFGASGGNVEPNATRVDNNGDLVIAGCTNASTFPTTQGAYQSNLAGGNDIYISKLSADGSTLLYSTLIGGTGNEASTIGDASYMSLTLGSSSDPRNPIEICFDKDNNIWAVSNSGSYNFPVTNNAYQGTNGGGVDAVLFCLDSTLSNLNYSTYLGGNGWDGGMACEIDDDGNVVVAGMTSSGNYPTTSGALHTNSQGGEDGFVTRVNTSTGDVMQSTYIGTSGQDDAERLDFDCGGHVFVAGRDFSGNYPVSSGVWRQQGGHIYVQKLSPDLSTSIKSTTLASTSGTFRLVVSGFMVDFCGDVVLGTIGTLASQSNLDLTNDAVQTTASPFYLAIISSDFMDLEFGSYLGTSADHYHPAVARLDKNGEFYQSVCTSGTTSDWPNIIASSENPNSWSPIKQNGGTNDIVTFKFNFDIASIKMAEITGHGGGVDTPHSVRGCNSAYFKISRRHADSVPLTIHYDIGGDAVNGTDYQQIPTDSVIIPAGDSVASIEIKALIVPNMPTGTKYVTLSVRSTCDCGGSGDNYVSVGTIAIIDSLYSLIPQPPDTVCAGDEVTISAEIDSTLEYRWTPEALIPDPRPLGLTIHPEPTYTTTYSLTVVQPHAPATCPSHKVSYKVLVEQYPEITMPAKDMTVCIQGGDSVDLTPYVTPEGVDYIYKWTPANHLRNDYSRINRFSAPPGDYHLSLIATTPWAKCVDTNDMTIHVVPPFHFIHLTGNGDTTINLGDAITLSATGDVKSWLWLPPRDINDPTLPHPTVKPGKSTIYKVIGIDKYGCRDTGYVNVHVEYQPNYFIPSAFSPNGDGLNDVFRVENLRYEKLLTFRIYNRRGQLVFISKNNENGWNGTVNGKPAGGGVYFYYIEVVLPNGEHKTLKGDVTLVR